MHSRTVFAPGKIILSGEYAVAFGSAGIAIPSSRGITVTYEHADECTVSLRGGENREEWKRYAQTIMNACGVHTGVMEIVSTLPVGKGMGASTALVVAIANALLDKPDEGRIRSIEDKVNPGHSGIDLAVIMRNRSIVFRSGETHEAETSFQTTLKDALLIDTGEPNESTADLVAWVKARADSLHEPLRVIGECTERLLRGENVMTVLPDHHRAQVSLGVVPEHVQELVRKIEEAGGAAKVIGAGGRTGGGGMVMALHHEKETVRNVVEDTYALLPS